MPCSAITASSMPRRPSSPPWIFGCSVLTRPSMISGKPVWLETSRTATPASASSPGGAAGGQQLDAAPRPGRAPARSGRSCRKRTGVRGVPAAAWMRPRGRRQRRPRAQLPASPNCFSFLRSVPRLMPRMPAARLWLPCGVVEHDAEQRLFDLAQHQVVQVRRPVAVQAGEVIAQCALGVIAQRQLPPVGSGGGGFASSSLLLCRHCDPPGKNHSSGRHGSPAHPFFQVFNRVRELCGCVLGPHQIPACLCRALQQLLAIPAEMFARDPDSGLLAVEDVQGVEMREDDITHLARAEVPASQFSRVRLGVDSTEDPWRAMARAADHYSVGAGEIKYLARFLRRIDVAVGEDRNAHVRT